jgi:hypothetical protein
MLRCSRDARLVFAGLWVFSDDYGVHPADALQLKAEVLPGDPVTEAEVLAWVHELIAQECIAEFTVPVDAADPELKAFAGRAFWISVNWHHQRIDRPTKPRAPIRALWLQASGRAEQGATSFAPPLAAAPDASPPPSAENAETAAWAQAFRRAQTEFAEFGLGNAKKPQDRNLALKTCYLVIVGRLREEWLREAVKAMKKAAQMPGGRFKPGALLTSVLKNKCAESQTSLDFRRLLAECPEPPDKEAPPAAPPSPPPASSPAPVAVDLAALAGAAVKAPPAPDKKPAQSGAELARQLRQLEAEARREAQQKKSA